MSVMMVDEQIDDYYTITNLISNGDMVWAGGKPGIYVDWWQNKHHMLLTPKGPVRLLKYILLNNNIKIVHPKVNVNNFRTLDDCRVGVNYTNTAVGIAAQTRGEPDDFIKHCYNQVWEQLEQGEKENIWPM